MAVRYKKKAKPLPDHKIEISKWKTFLSANIASEGLATEETAEKIIALIGMLTSNHLLCHECGRVMDDEAFYHQVAHVTRRKRALICKECWKTAYYKKNKE